MGVLSRLFKTTETEQRNTSPALLAMLTGGGTSAGVSVTPETAVGYSAVLACVRVLAEGVAQLPLILYERQERGRRRAAEHPLYGLLHTAPNPFMTSFEWRELMMAHLALWGDGYNEIERNGAGRPLALWPLMPDAMKVLATPDGGRRYEYRHNSRTFSLRADQVLHVPGLGFDGLQGKSLIRMARESVGLGIAAQRYGAAVFGNGEVPGGVLQHPGTLGDTAYDHLRTSWAEQHQGLNNAHRLAILEEGMKYQATGIPPEDAQFLETRKFQRTEIAAIFRVPPHMIGDLERATFSNIEQQSLDFVIYTVGPWIERIEQRLEMSLLTQAERGRFYVEHLVAGLLRGDMASRYQSYAVGRQWGWFSANDVRELENMNPVDGGDTYLVPMNMMDAGQPPEPASNAVGDKAQADQPGEQNVQAANRALPLAERRAAAAGRRRVMQVATPALEDAAQRVINRETNDIGNAARKWLKSAASAAAPEHRNAQQFLDWLAKFVEEHQGFVYERLWAPWYTMAQLVADQALAEAEAAGHEPVDVAANVEAFAKGMLRSRSITWTEQLQTRLKEVIERAEADGDDPLDAVEAVLLQRREKESSRWARNVGTAVGNAVAVTVFSVVGVQLLRWLASSGEKTCAYCEAMDGRVVGTMKVFVSAGDGVEPKGHDALRPGSDISHPPLHEGCNCIVVPD